VTVFTVTYTDSSTGLGGGPEGSVTAPDADTALVVVLTLPPDELIIAAAIVPIPPTAATEAPTARACHQGPVGFSTRAASQVQLMMSAVPAAATAGEPSTY